MLKIQFFKNIHANIFNHANDNFYYVNRIHEIIQM